jgi:hypothetical protein
MSKHVHSFAERHPGMEEGVRKLAASNAAFSDICGRFERLWDSLNENENEPVDADRARRELRHLEQEMLAMFHDQMRV